MAARQVPKRGDPIIEVREDSLGGKKLTATLAFQVYLESLTDAETESTPSDQQIEVLFASIGAINGRIAKLSAEQLDAVQSIFSGMSQAVRASVTKEIAEREDLEQVVYDN